MLVVNRPNRVLARESPEILRVPHAGLEIIIVLFTRQSCYIKQLYEVISRIYIIFNLPDKMMKLLWWQNQVTRLYKMYYNHIMPIGPTVIKRTQIIMTIVRYCQQKINSRLSEPIFTPSGFQNESPYYFGYTNGYCVDFTWHRTALT